MRFLADESCDFGVVRALRAINHDVTAVSEIAPRAPDEDVIAIAVREDRILLTEDKDFGQLVFARRRKSVGVILIRWPSRARARLSETVVHLVVERGDELAGRFVVVQPNHIRIGRSPDVQ